MAWNEPGGNGGNNSNGDKDPWGPRKKNDGPPDLDEILKNVKKKINGWFGGGGGKGGKSGSDSSGGGGIGISVLLVIGLIVWGGTGFYSVDQAARGVVQRFGVPTETTGPGLHWHLPYPIEKVTVVDVDRNREHNFNNVMLTKDEKLVTISINVNYSIGDINKFMFANDDPIKTLEEALDSSVREVLSTLVLEEVLGQQEIASHRSKSQLRQCNIIYDNDPIVNPSARPLKIAKAKKGAKAVKSVTTRITDIKVIAPLVKLELVKLLKKYKTGITINSVNFQKPQPPSAKVSDAFEDVIRAQEDATRYVEAAWGYCQQIVNTAHGEKDKILKDAEAYKQRKVLDARGEVSRFKQVLVEYERAPEVTRRRLYLETQELILSRVSKIFIKSKSGGNIMMLPLDKFLQGAVGQKPGSLLK